MRRWGDLLKSILTVSVPDPEDARRRRLLNVTLVFVFAAALAMLVALAIVGPLGLAGERTEVTALIVGIAVSLLGVIAVYTINRRVSGEVASTCFLLLLTAVAALSDEPARVTNGRGLLVFAFPIVLASFLLRPAAGFGLAAASSVALVILSQVAGVALPGVPSLLALFALALVAWVSAKSLSRTSGALAVANSRAAERSEALAREAREQEVLAEIGRIIGSSLDIEEVYGRFAEQVKKLVRFDRIAIAATDLENGTTTSLYVAGTRIPSLHQGVPIHLPAGDEGGKIVGWANAGMPGPLILDSAETRALAAHWPPDKAALECGLIASMSVPIR